MKALPFIELNTPLGLFRIEALENSIVKAYFSGFAFIQRTTKITLKKRAFPRASENEKHILKEAHQAVVAYFGGELSALNEIRVSPVGTDFQIKVWSKLRQIKAGDTITYGKIATNIGSETAARAVGQACGKNPILLFVPCHRVICSNNHLGGYSANIKRKIFLLQHEGILL